MTSPSNSGIPTTPFSTPTLIDGDQKIPKLVGCNAFRALSALYASQDRPFKLHLGVLTQLAYFSPFWKGELARQRDQYLLALKLLNFPAVIGDVGAFIDAAVKFYACNKEEGVDLKLSKRNQALDLTIIFFTSLKHLIWALTVLRGQTGKFLFVDLLAKRTWQMIKGVSGMLACAIALYRLNQVHNHRKTKFLGSSQGIGRDSKAIYGVGEVEAKHVVNEHLRHQLGQTEMDMCKTGVSFLEEIVKMTSLFAKTPKPLGIAINGCFTLLALAGGVNKYFTTHLGRHLKSHASL